MRTQYYLNFMSALYAFILATDDPTTNALLESILKLANNINK